MSLGSIGPVRGISFVLLPWSPLFDGKPASASYRVHMELVGIPEHAWSRSTAASILARSCKVLSVDKATEQKRDMSSFKLVCWSSNPDDIPCEVTLRIPLDEKHFVDYSVTIQPKEIWDMTPSTAGSSGDGDESFEDWSTFRRSLADYSFGAPPEQM